MADYVMKMASCSLSLVFFTVLLSGYLVDSVPYDHSYINECLSTPLKPQYGGGIVVNPEMNEGLQGWTTLGDSKLESRELVDGNKYIVVSNRKRSNDSFVQEFALEENKVYTFSAWLQVSEGEADVAAVFETDRGSKYAGWVVARSGCWSMLKGGLSVDEPGSAYLYFESNNTEVEIWADSISLQPFSQEEWKSHQQESIQMIRQSKVKFQAVDQQGRPLPNATLTIIQLKNNFPFGCALSSQILNNVAYQNWFSSRFKYTVFENEFKWYSTEGSQGKENYGTPDAMLRFCKAHGVQTRGHNVFWDDPKFQPSWVPSLPTDRLRSAVENRINSVMKRYNGQLIHWDVVNENMHFNFFESRLGGDFSTVYYKKANQIDGRATPFLNEFNTIEESRDGAASPAAYLRKISQIRRGYGGPLGIGLEGHFTAPNLGYIRSALDTLASAKLPIWVTELDVSASANQANFLEQIIRELLAHRSVQGIIIWAAWKPQGCYKMCLTDNNFKNLATGDVVDKILRDMNPTDLVATTDSQGFFEASLFHGEYEARLNHPTNINSSVLHKFRVEPAEESETPLRFKIYA